MQTEIVLNMCYGGYSLSRKAVHRYAELAGLKLYFDTDKWGNHTPYLDPKLTQHFDVDEISRMDPRLVQVVRELGAEANGSYAQLEIVSFDPEPRIYDHDGYESLTQ